MNNDIEIFHKQIIETILNANTEEDLEEFNISLLNRQKWVDSYVGEDKKEVILNIVEKDKEIIRLLQNKMKLIEEKIIQEDKMNRNRGVYKLYE